MKNSNANFYVNVILKEKLAARQKKKRANVLSQNQNVGRNLRKCAVSSERTIHKELFELLGKLDLYRKILEQSLTFTGNKHTEEKEAKRG